MAAAAVVVIAVIVAAVVATEATAAGTLTVEYMVVAATQQRRNINSNVTEVLVTAGVEKSQVNIRDSSSGNSLAAAVLVTSAGVVSVAGGSCK